MHFNTRKSPSKDRWIPNVVETHFMEICYFAWLGFQIQGQGLVLCEVNVDGNYKPSARQFSYLSIQDAIAHFERLEFYREDIKGLSQAIEDYNPKREIILMLTGRGDQFVTRLENLKILPEAAYKQVCARWDEYSLALDNALKI